MNLHEYIKLIITYLQSLCVWTTETDGQTTYSLGIHAHTRLLQRIFSPTLPHSLTHLPLTYLVASMSTTMPSPPAPETYVPHPTFHYDRDFRGYGEQGLQGLQWPNKAKIAVSFVINYEEVRSISLYFYLSLTSKPHHFANLFPFLFFSLFRRAVNAASYRATANPNPT